jgi:3-deoxy-D-manno-octulosonic-acid transferase
MSLLFAWLLNVAYAVVILLASPWILFSALRHGKYREGFAEKLLGLTPKRMGDRPCVWLHAVSVGEVNLLATTIAEIVKREPNWEIVVSTTTKTGYDLARKKYADRTVFYCPLDFSWATATAMRRVRPSLLVLAELELWPNLIRAAKRQAAQVAIINGRLSDKSFRGYRRLQPLVSRVLLQVDMIAAQNEETAERFRKLGAATMSVHATGSLKFDGAQTDRANPRTKELRRVAGLCDDEPVLLVGSTQAPEEEYAITVLQRLSAEYPKLRLIIVPRHPERFNEVAALAASAGISWLRRSEIKSISAQRPWRVLLVDTIGELGAWWGGATIGFVGGSFGDRGGQNMLEPAAYGVATCFGPNTWNFRDIVSQLLAANGAVVVEDAHGLEAFVRRSLAEPAWASGLGRRAQDLVILQQGATRRTVDLLCSLRKYNAIPDERRAA